MKGDGADSPYRMGFLAEGSLEPGKFRMKGSKSPPDNLVDVPCSLKDVPLVGNVWRFHFSQL